MKWLHFLISKSKWNFRKPILVFFQTSFAILTVGLTACNGTPVVDNSRNGTSVIENSHNGTPVIDNLHPYFPTQKNVKDRHTLGTEGTLIVDNGYLRLNGYLLIWPNGFSFDTNNTEIRILDQDKIEVARVGNVIIVGGGIVDKGGTERIIGEKLPDGAKGPFWIVGQVVSSAPPNNNTP